MLGQRDFTSQRSCERYQAKSDAYAIIKQDQYSEMAQIIDISKSGISFLCLNEGNWDSKSFTIDFLCQGLPGSIDEESKLKDIPLQPIAYSTDPLDIPQASPSMKRCGVSFGKLSPMQQAKLNEYIIHNTCGSA